MRGLILFFGVNRFISLASRTPPAEPRPEGNDAQEQDAQGLGGEEAVSHGG